MPRAGDEIEGFGGLRLRFVELEPERLEMEATYSGEAGMPPEHLHPRQRESFEVIAGSMQTIIGGEGRVYEEGESFEVPEGTPHRMAAQVPTRLRWEVRPALRTAEFFERLYGDGPGSFRETGESFFEEFADEFRLTGT